MKIKSGVNIVGVKCGAFDLFYKEIKFYEIFGEKEFKDFIFNVVIHEFEINIKQSILSDIVYITTSTLIDYERIIEWLDVNAIRRG